MKPGICITVAVALAFAVSCAGPRAFTKGTYEDPKTIALLDDQFNENDMQLIAKKMIESMAGSNIAGSNGAPVVMIGKMRNRTSEHIDMTMLSNKVRTQLVQSGRFRFADVQNRGDIAEEYEYQQSGYVDPDQARGPGSQTGAEYLLTGTLTANVQQVGKNKLVYYKATFQLTNLLTSEIAWTDEKEIRKAYKKRHIGI
jgi:uncharacterized protein (TIGR02722 family)